jgi:hypothetical protein
MSEGRTAVRVSSESSLSRGRSLLIAYGLPLLGGAMVAGLTALIFWIIQSYLV